MALAPRRSEAGSLPFPQSERRVTHRELRLMPRGYSLDLSWTREQWADACRCIERDEPIYFAPQPWQQAGHGSTPLRNDPPHDMLSEFMAWLWGDDDDVESTS